MSESQQSNGLLPTGVDLITWEGFTGLNTNASRVGIKDTELFICDGFFPLGPNWLRTLPGSGTAIWNSTTGGKPAVSLFGFVNIGSTPYCIVFLADGSIWAINTGTSVITNIAPAATIPIPSVLNVGLSQWNSAYALIVYGSPTYGAAAPPPVNGYWMWGGVGTAFSGAGGLSPLIDVTDGGSGYTSPPTVTAYGGAGSGATFQAVLINGAVSSVTLLTPGTGYLPGDSVQLAFSGGGSDTSPILTATLASGVVQQLVIVAAGTNYPTGTFPLGFSGGGGSGAAGTFTTAGGIVVATALTDGGSGYTGTPTVTTPLPGSGAAITATEAGGAVNALSIVTGGANYVPGTYPLAFSGGAGSGASATYTVNASGVVASTTIVAGGTGYTSGPTVTIPTGSGAVIVPSITAGAVASITVVDGGTNLIGTPTATITGGGGSGATVVLTVSGGIITGADVTEGGSGYTSVPDVEVASGYNNAAAATIDPMPFSISGTAITTYTGRVWIINGINLTYSAPGSPTDFSTSDGGGVSPSSDATLRYTYTGLVSTNGYLYLIGDSSVGYLSGVNVSSTGGVTTTSFAIQNADPQTGTPYPATIGLLGQDVLFANSWGAQASYGGRVTKTSEPLDGIYATVPNFNGVQLSAAVATIFGKRVWMVLVPVVDQVSQATVNKLLMWDRQKWWTSQQDITMNFIASQEISSVLTAFGTDGNVIAPLFQAPSIGFTKTAQSKLWYKPHYCVGKVASRLWGLAQYYDTGSPDLTVSIDQENAASSYSVTIPPALDAAGDISVFGPTAVAQQGVLTGLTISTTAADMALVSVAVGETIMQYRG